MVRHHTVTAILKNITTAPAANHVYSSTLCWDHSPTTSSKILWEGVREIVWNRALFSKTDCVAEAIWTQSFADYAGFSSYELMWFYSIRPRYPPGRIQVSNDEITRVVMSCCSRRDIGAQRLLVSVCISLFHAYNGSSARWTTHISKGPYSEYCCIHHLLLCAWAFEQKNTTQPTRLL